MRKRILAGICAAVISVMPVGAFAADDTQAVQQDITAADVVMSTGVTSMQYALIDNGEIVVSDTEGMYSLSEPDALSADTMYGAGSVSKMFTTACVMKLYEDGFLDIDKPVTEYIPEFTMADERYKDITVRMLLNHSSGLMGSTTSNAFLYNDNDTYAHDALLDELKDQRLKADPGAFSVYCNDGFTLAEIVAERVSGKDFTTLLREMITEPLGLSNTKTPLDEFDRGRLAKAYKAGTDQELPAENINIIGAGGIYSTAEDLCVFAQIYMGDTDVLSTETAELTAVSEYEKGMHPSGESYINYGLGWDDVSSFPFERYGITGLTKGGDTLNYHASLVVLPHQHMAAAVMTSGGSSLVNMLFANRLLLDRLKANGIIAEELPDEVFEVYDTVPMPEEYTEYSGIYALTGSAYDVTVNADGTLTLAVWGAEDMDPSLTTVNYVYTDNGIFVPADETSKNQQRLEFAEENSNTYIKMSVYQTVPTLCQIAGSDFLAQKLEPEEGEEMSEVWKNRVGKKYYPLNEKYSSAVYALGNITSELLIDEELPGYISMEKIVDEDTAEATIEIPGTAGRDMSDVEFRESDGRELMYASNSVFVSEDDVDDIYIGGDAVCTILEDGFARWYTVPVTEKELTMRTEIPENASFAVFDSAGTNTSFSWADGSTVVALPMGGSVVFVGDAGSEFSIHID